MNKTAIVVPCYNEAGRLDPGKFTEIVDRLESLNFIFVNDGSVDDTQKILDEMRLAKPGRISSIELVKNVGKAEAVRRGVVKALEDGFDYVGYWDADLSTPLDTLNDFIKMMEAPTSPGMIMASRVKLMGRHIERKIVRHYLGRLFATMASMALNLPVYDTQCGAKMFKNSESIKKVFSKPFMTDWIFDVEMLARFRIEEGASKEKAVSGLIVEYPLHEWKDIAGSKLRPTSFITAFWDLIKIILLYSPRLYRLK